MTRPENVVDFTPDPDLFPFESTWFDSSVGPIHYIDEGQGRPLLFFHGNPDWSFLYRNIITELRGQFRCIAMDFPGFGLSVHPEDPYGYTPAEHAAVVLELVEELDLHDVIVMGADWGGPIGLDIASRIPDRIGGLVVGNSWAWPTDSLMLKSFGRLMSSRPLQALIRRRNFFVTVAMKTALERGLTDAEFTHYTAVVPTAESRRGIAEFPKQISASRAWLAQLEQRVAANLSDKPMLLLWGMKDPAFRNLLDRWTTRFPHAKVVRLPAASHYLQEDEPEKVAAAIAKTYGPPARR